MFRRREERITDPRNIKAIKEAIERMERKEDKAK